MKEIMEEYGEFIIEAIAGTLLVTIVAFLFLGGTMSGLIGTFVTSVLGV